MEPNDMMFKMITDLQKTVNNGFDKVNDTMIKIELDLADHIRRTEIAEKRLDNSDNEFKIAKKRISRLEKPFIHFSFINSTVKYIIYVVGGVYVALQVFDIVKNRIV